MSDKMNEAPKQPLALLYTALAKAQGAFRPIEKNREVEITLKSGGKFKFRYADLDEILNKTRPALSANGLALIQLIQARGAGSGESLVCQLMHSDGGTITSELLMPTVRDMSDPKSFGATLTYLRRYLVTAILGVAADDDLDADGQEMTETSSRGNGKPAVTMPTRKPAAPATEQPPPQADNTSATGGEIAYLTKKIAAKGMTVAQACQLIERENLDGLTKTEFTELKDALL